MTGFSGFLLLIFLGYFTNVEAIFGVRKPILLDPPKNVTVAGTRIEANLYFTQKVDNFNPADTRTWQQRYHINTDYSNEASKNHVFLLLGGEWEATERWLNYGAWIETAKQYGALLIYLEHRYYGTSQPLTDLSTDNLQYLSAPQALQDAANFIQGINNERKLPSDVKWVVFGGSYAGTLAAWLRQQYPDLVAGAISSSAPLEAILDFHEYLQVVRNGMARHSTQCVENIKVAYSQLDELTSTCLEDADIFRELDNMFQLCETIETSEGNEKDLTNLFEYLTDNNFAYVVQYSGMVEVTIDDVCQIMVNEVGGATELQRLGQVNARLLQFFGETCTDYKYHSLLADWRNTTISASSMMRQWFYQTCTEFGFFQTSNQDSPVFGSLLNVGFFTDLCVDVFGERFNEAFTISGIEATNKRYSAKNISTSNIVYFHGDIDPWHVLGKLETSDEIEDKVIIVEGVAHCANMQAPSNNDPQALTAARREIDDLIRQWLGVPGDDSSSTKNIVSLYVLSAVSLIFYLLY